MKKSDRGYRVSRRKIVIWAIAASAALVFASTVSVAIFTNSLNAQRTIAAYDTEGARFSSNYLLRGDSKDNERTLYTTNALLPVTGAVTVCNYQQGRQTLSHPNDITYTLTARFVRYDENEQDRYVPVTAAYLTSQSLTDYSITVSDGANSIILNSSNLSGTITSTLTGGSNSPDSDAYNLTFSTNFSNKPNLYLEVIATPSAGSLPTLRGVFLPDLRAEGATNYWTGAFRDDTSHTPASYDGFNYLITGTGSGAVTLTWDSAKVDLSDVAKDTLLSISGATQSGSSITFPVDSDVESRYDLQFYKVNITSETWPQMSSQVVTFSFS